MCGTSSLPESYFSISNFIKTSVITQYLSWVYGDFMLYFHKHIPNMWNHCPQMNEFIINTIQLMWTKLNNNNPEITYYSTFDYLNACNIKISVVQMQIWVSLCHTGGSNKIGLIVDLVGSNLEWSHWFDDTCQRVNQTLLTRQQHSLSCAGGSGFERYRERTWHLLTEATGLTEKE